MGTHARHSTLGTAVQTQTYMVTRVNTQAYSRAYGYTRVQVGTHVNTQAHAHMGTHTYRHTHIYKHSCAQAQAKMGEGLNSPL